MRNTAPNIKTSKKKRPCLKCGKNFLSRGPYNRLCEKCALANERVAPSMYSVNPKSREDTNSLENRVYGIDISGSDLN